jgi:cadmium resistance protein CadD (predicted permease)
MRAIAGSILILTALICILAGSVTDIPAFVAFWGCMPLALGVYFLLSKDKSGA